ncbi:MAG: hypothetical protein WD557_19425 [Dehalococcoidia bacterium]
MGALIGHLEELLGRGCSELELIRAVEDELTGGDLLDDELADECAAIRLGDHYERQLKESLDRAATRTAADREALRLTLLYAHRGGLYLPGETEAQERSRDQGWRAREAVRFACFAVIVPSLVRRLEQGAMPAGDYPSAIAELATRISRIAIHVSRARH